MTHVSKSRALTGALIAGIISVTIAGATSVNDAAEKVAAMVSEIQRGDYEGDQAKMQRGYDELEPFVNDQTLGPRVRYWRGFAQWRRALNGFNDSVGQSEQEQHLRTALDEFRSALEKDKTFVDAKVGTISCLGILAFMNRKDQARAQEFSSQVLRLLKEAIEVAPDNPRLIWVRGPIFWNTPPDKGGGQDKAIENWEHGLEMCSKLKPVADPLEPSWGKPELLMNLAYADLNKSSPDLDAAERYARSAVQIVPYWHYVRDILLPQILTAKAKAK
jgi:tetratricopeptide (TPR) repeat protein